MANETAFIPPSIQDEQDYAAIRDDVAKRYPQLDALLKTDEAAIRQAISGDAAPPKVGNPDFQAAIDQHFMTSTSNYLTAIDVLNGRLSPAELNKVLGRSEDRPRAEAMFRDALMQVASTPAFESVRPKDTRNALGQIATQFGRGVGDIARNTESLAVDFLGAPFLSADDSRDRTLAADIRSVKERVDPAGLTPHEGYSFWHGVLSGVRSAPFAIGGTAASLAGGLPAAIGYTFTQTAPDAYREYKSRGLSDKMALAAAIGTGALEAYIEQLLPFEKQFMPEFKAVITDSLRQRLTKFAVEHGANFLKENLEEVLQDASREAVGKLAAVVSQNPKYDGFDWSKFDASSIAETATAVATMMAPGTVVAGNNIRMGMPDARQMLSDEFLEAWTKLHPDTPLKQGMSRTEFDKAVGVGRGKMNEIQRDAFAARATEMQAGILAKNSETNQVEGDSGENGTEEAPFVLRDSIKVKFDSGLDAALYQVATKPNAKRTASVIAEIAEAIGQPPDVVNRMATRLAEAVEKGRDAAKLSGNERFTFAPFYDPKNIDEDLLKPPGGQTGAVPNNAEAPTAESVQTPTGVPNEEGQADRQGREGQQRLLTPKNVGPNTGLPDESPGSVKTPDLGDRLRSSGSESDLEAVLELAHSEHEGAIGPGDALREEQDFESGQATSEIPSRLTFNPHDRQSRSAFKELQSKLPKELKYLVQLGKKTGVSASEMMGWNGADIVSKYGTNAIVDHLVRMSKSPDNARSPRLAKIRATVEWAIANPEMAGPDLLWAAQKWKSLQTAKADKNPAVAGHFRNVKPENINVSDLSVGDKFDIGGDEHTVTQIDPDTGTVTVKDGITLDLPDSGFLTIDKGTHRSAGGDVSFDTGATSGTIETQPPQQPPTPQPEPQYTPGVPTETQSGAVHGTQQQTADSAATEAPEARTEAPKQENAHSGRPPVPPENIAAFSDLLDRKKGPRAFHTRGYARAISMAAEAIHEPEKRASAEEMARIGAERFNANPSGETARLLPIVDSGRAFENAQDVHIAREMVNQLASAALKTGNEKEIQKAVEREVRFRNTATQASDLLRAYRDYEDGPAARAAAIRAAFYSPPLWMTGDDAARKWGDKLKSLTNDLLKERIDVASMMEPSFYENSQNLTEPIDESTEQGKALADALRSLKRAFTIASQKLFSSAGLPPLDAELVKAFGNVVYQAAKYGMVRFKQFVRQVSRQIGTDRTIAAGRELQAAWDQHAKQDKRLDASSNVKDILRPKRDSKGNVPKVNLFEGKSIKEWAYVMRRIQTMKADYADKAFEYWINVSVLSGLRTMVANTLGNASNLTWRLFVDRSWQGLLNDIQRAAGMDVAKSAPALADAVTVAKGLMYGMKDAYRLAWLTWDLELNYHGGSQKFDEAPTSIGGTTGRVVRTPGRMNNAVDMFFRTISARAVAGATANRIAINEGLTGQAKSDRIGELLEDMESEAWHSAYNEADVITLREQLDPLSSQLLALKRQYRALNYIFLFVSITSNTLRQGLRMVPPIGTAEFAYRYLRGQLKDNPELTRELINRQLLGLMMLGTIASTNDPDDPWITGAEDAASGARDFQRREGNKHPLSIKLPIVGWVSYRSIEPIATMLATMVDEVSAMKKANGVIDFADRFSSSLTRQIQSKTFLQYFGDMINGMVEAGRYAGGDTDAQGLFQQMAHWAVNFTESWVDPALVRQAFNAADPYQRDTRVWANGDQFFEQVVDRALQRNWAVKFWTGEYGPMRYDLWGRPMVKTGSPLGDPTSSFFWRLLSPIEYFGDKEPYIGDRILAKHNELYEDLYPKAPQRSYQLNGKSRSMTDEQFDEFAHLSGVVTRNIIDRMELREVPEAAVYIQEAVSWAREQVRKRLVGEWHGGDTGPVDTDMLGRVGAAELLRKHPEAARPDRLDTPGTFQIRRDETMRRNMELIQRRQNALNPR